MIFILYLNGIHQAFMDLNLSFSYSNTLTLSPILIIIFTFVSGLFIGLGIKKGVTAFLLTLIGLFLAGYVGLTFVPKISLTYEFHKWSSFLMAYISSNPLNGVEFGLSLILFLIGFAIGLWKG